MWVADTRASLADAQDRRTEAEASRILADAVRELGGEPIPLGIVADDLERLRARLAEALGRLEGNAEAAAEYRRLLSGCRCGQRRLFCG